MFYQKLRVCDPMAVKTNAQSDPIARMIFIIVAFLILSVLAGISGNVGKLLATLTGVYVLVAVINPNSGLMSGIETLHSKL